MNLPRREFVALVGGAAVGWPLAARGQRPERTRRIGVLMPYAKDDAVIEARMRIFRQELARLGWVEGSGVLLDELWTTYDMDRVRSNAASLVNTDPDAIVAIGGRVIPILMQLTQAIPIVIPGAGDPVGNGYVSNLARPGVNVTGFSFFETSIVSKTLELLKQIAPAISRVGLVFNPDNPAAALYRPVFDNSTVSLSIEPLIEPIHNLSDIEHIVAALAERKNGGVLFAPDITVTALRHDIIELVDRYHVPAIYSDDVFVQDGGLASYNTDRNDLFRRAAGYVDRILRGEKVGDLPFQQPTKYVLMINVKAAKSLGLTVPQTLLVAADEVIE